MSDFQLGFLPYRRFRVLRKFDHPFDNEFPMIRPSVLGVFMVVGRMTFAGACALRRWRACLPALVLAAACGSEPPTRVGATVIVRQGAGQADTIETQLPVPLKVAVRDTLGRPAPNVAVDWGTAGDCGLAPATCIALVAAEPSDPPAQTLRTVTNAAGESQVWVQLGPLAQSAGLAIVVPDLGVAIEAPFDVRPGAAAELSVPAPDVAVALGFVGRLDAAVVDRRGNRLTTPLTFTPDVPGVVDIAPDGELGSVAFGRTTVTIEGGGFTQTGYVSVVPAGLLAVGTIGGAPTALVVNTTGTSRIPIPPVDVQGEPVNASALAWGPDDRLAFQIRHGNVNPRLFTATLGGTPVPLVPAGASSDTAAAQPRWSRDGQWIYYSASGFQPVYTSSEIWRVHPDGSGAERVGESATTEGDYSPDPSPDGTAVVFASTRSRDGAETAVVVRDLETGDEHPVGVGILPRWSPDGQWITYIHDFTDGGYGAVWLVRPDGAEGHPITTPGVFGEQGIDWSPDSQWIAGFDSRGISLVQVSTGMVLPIGQLQYFVFPAWHP